MNSHSLICLQVKVDISFHYYATLFVLMSVCYCCKAPSLSLSLSSTMLRKWKWKHRIIKRVLRIFLKEKGCKYILLEVLQDICEHFIEEKKREKKKKKE